VGPAETMPHQVPPVLHARYAASRNVRLSAFCVLCKKDAPHTGPAALPRSPRVVSCVLPVLSIETPVGQITPPPLPAARVGV